ncbi:MAG: type IV pilin N-terminal domain-containing protein, partial [Thermoplasmata archaeon]|nr:type IV pilin N-terminal domain-containing protein [Thermoplasmata archaeon]
MVKKQIYNRKCDEQAVSEVVGTLFLLVMTVAFFSSILLWVYNFDTPDSEARVVLFPTMERMDSDTTNVSIVHRGGEPIPKGSPYIILNVQNATDSSIIGPFNYSDGWQEPGDWRLGDRWSHVFTGVPEDARVVVQVIDRAQETVVLRTELQRGLFSGGDARPIVGIPVVLPSDTVVATGKEEFYIRAIAADFDNDLPDNGLVADLRPVWNGLGTVYLTHRGFGVFESPMITLPAAAFPGEYNINVTAT